MAKEGFVIGMAPDTATNPTGYWDGTQQVTSIDNALFYDDLREARIAAGNLQVTDPGIHIEAYSAILSITHEPALTGAGI